MPQRPIILLGGWDSDPPNTIEKIWIVEAFKTAIN